MKILTYRGYTSAIRYDDETGKLYGTIEGITDFVNFIVENGQDIEEEFHSAVDDYLLFCKQVNKAPAVLQCS